MISAKKGGKTELVRLPEKNEDDCTETVGRAGQSNAFQNEKRIFDTFVGDDHLIKLVIRVRYEENIAASSGGSLLYKNNLKRSYSDVHAFADSMVRRSSF